MKMHTHGLRTLHIVFKRIVSHQHVCMCLNFFGPSLPPARASCCSLSIASSSCLMYPSSSAPFAPSAPSFCLKAAIFA